MPTPEFSRQASENDETSWFFSRLFAGIDLPAELQASARKIIADCVHQMRAVHAPPINAWDHWDAAMKQYAERDRKLGELVSGPSHELFERNVAMLQQHFDAIRASAFGS
jgi:hypothetical protein